MRSTAYGGVLGLSAQEKMKEPGEEALIEIGEISIRVIAAVTADLLYQPVGKLPGFLATAIISDARHGSVKPPPQHLFDSVAHLLKRQPVDDKIARSRIYQSPPSPRLG